MADDVTVVGHEFTNGAGHLRGGHNEQGERSMFSMKQQRQAAMREVLGLLYGEVCLAPAAEERATPRPAVGPIAARPAALPIPSAVPGMPTETVVFPQHQPANHGLYMGHLTRALALRGVHSMTALGICGLLMSMGTSGTYPGSQWMARQLGIHANTVYKAEKGLVRAGFLEFTGSLQRRDFRLLPVTLEPTEHPPVRGPFGPGHSTGNPLPVARTTTGSPSGGHI